MNHEASSSFVVFGGGSWGTALAHSIAKANQNVHLLVRDADVAKAINTQHMHPKYVQNLLLDPRVQATTDEAILRTAQVIVLAIPFQSIAANLPRIAPYLTDNVTIINAAKGLDLQTNTTLSGMINGLLPQWKGAYAMLSGPSFANEVLCGQPTAVVLACTDSEIGTRLRAACSSTTFRCYSSTDVLGVELGGALKNIMAIASGVATGFGLQDNARAALITRGLAEMSRIGLALGAEAKTFMGLSGLGDLLLTCTGDLSRNRQVGIRLGQGERLEHIVATLGMVAEGVKTTEAVYSLTQEKSLAAPITEAVHSILCGKAPKESITELMARALKEE